MRILSKTTFSCP